MLQQIKDFLRPSVHLIRSCVLGAPPVRKRVTRNYSSGKLALGEQNKYGIPFSWITVDWNDADVIMNFKDGQRLPFSDDSQSVIYSSHMVEHLDDKTLKHVLGEACRVLKKGGGIRIEAPDAEVLFRDYLGDKKICKVFAEDNKKAIVQGWGWPEVYGQLHVGFIGILSCYVLKNQHVPVIASQEEVDSKIKTMSLEDFGHWCVSLQSEEQKATGGHINTLSFDKMKTLLTQAGFSEIKKMGLGETIISGLNLKGIERRDRGYYSFYIDAIK